MIGWYTLISYQWRLTAQKIEFNEDSGVGIISGWIRYSVSAVLMSAECEGQNQFCDNTAPAAPAPFYPPPANLSPTGALHNSINLSRFLSLGSQYSHPENCECLDRAYNSVSVIHPRNCSGLIMYCHRRSQSECVHQCSSGLWQDDQGWKY